MQLNILPNTNIFLSASMSNAVTLTRGVNQIFFVLIAFSMFPTLHSRRSAPTTKWSIESPSLNRAILPRLLPARKAYHWELSLALLWPRSYSLGGRPYAHIITPMETLTSLCTDKKRQRATKCPLDRHQTSMNWQHTKLVILTEGSEKRMRLGQFCSVALKIKV